MEIFGRGFSDYLEVCKNPFLAYVAVVLVLTFVSFASFQLYAILGGISVMFYFGLCLYVGWSGAKKGMDGFQPVAVGAIFGLGVGLLQGLAIALLVTQNPSYTAFFDSNIGEIVANYSLSRQEAINSLALSSVLSSPFVWAFISAVLAVLGGLGARYLGGAKKTGYEVETEKAEAQESPDSRRKRPSKKFRRRK